MSFPMMPGRPPPQRKRTSLPAWLVVIPISVVRGVSVFAGIWVYLTPRERHMIVPIVPYSEFMTDVHDGNVDQIQIHQREIRYRSHHGDRVLFLETNGPEPDQGMLDSLKPTDPSKPAPMISLLK